MDEGEETSPFIISTYKGEICKMARWARLSHLKGNLVVESKQSGERLTVSELVERITYSNELDKYDEEWFVLEDPSKSIVWGKPIKIDI